MILLGDSGLKVGPDELAPRKQSSLVVPTCPRLFPGPPSRGLAIGHLVVSTSQRQLQAKVIAGVREKALNDYGLPVGLSRLAV